MGFLATLIILALLGSAFAYKRDRFGQGLAVDIEVPYERALKAVQQVAENGTIQGTAQYRGTSQLEGASAAQKAPGFKDWNGKGAVFYKVRPDTIAPEHFYATGDKGTVAVRYILEPGGPKLTHLRIDASYQEDDGHGSHPSDGQVENSEFAVVSKQLDDMAEAERTQQKRGDLKQQEQKLEDLQAEFEQENAALKAATAKQQQLEQEIRELNGARSGHVRRASADVKAEPYNQSKTILSLSQGDAVTVLMQTPSWCRVQTANGQEGWVYHLMLDVAP